MNRIISVYELLGLMKDGKAPKKMKYGEINFIYIEEEDYYNEKTNNLYLFKDYICTLEDLNDKVEILEDKKEELELLSWQQIGYLDRALEEIVKDINTQNKKTNGKINEIIRYLKNKEDKNN